MSPAMLDVAASQVATHRTPTKGRPPPPDLLPRCRRLPNFCTQQNTPLRARENKQQQQPVSVSRGRRCRGSRRRRTTRRSRRATPTSGSTPRFAPSIALCPSCLVAWCRGFGCGLVWGLRVSPRRGIGGVSPFMPPPADTRAP
jgi:hypothetical protein